MPMMTVPSYAFTHILEMRSLEADSMFLRRSDTAAGLLTPAPQTFMLFLLLAAFLVWKGLYCSCTGLHGCGHLICSWPLTGRLSDKYRAMGARNGSLIYYCICIYDLVIVSCHVYVKQPPGSTLRPCTA